MRYNAGLITNGTSLTDEMVPIDDISIVNWNKGAGPDAEAWKALDEGYLSFDDSTSYWYNTLAQATFLECKLTSRTTPSSPDKMRLRWRAKSSAIGTIASAQCRIVQWTGSSHVEIHTDGQSPGLSWTLFDPGLIDCS